MRSYQQFLAELKRRHVFKVAAVYGVVAFGLIQIADPLAGALHLPDTFLTYVVAILLLGFPLALVLAWAFEVTPDGVRPTVQAAPGVLEQIVAQPASKRWPAGLMALVGVAALVAGAWWVGRQTARDLDVDSADPTAAPGPADVRLALAGPADDTRPSLAVLPFADMSPEGDQEYFSDGMTEEILNTLARIRELKVAARTSAFAFKGKQVDMRAVGDSLGVAYLIEGSVRKSGDRLRITAQLIDAADGSHLWSDQYDRTMDDVFAIQSEIAHAIAEELRVPLGLDDASELVTPTADLEAYDLYLAGRARLRERGPSLSAAVRLFEAAVALDSAWAPAWAGLAEARELIGWYPVAWEDGRPPTPEQYREGFVAFQGQAESAAGRALQLDPNNASAHIALGSVHRNRREWEFGEAAYVRALELDPDDAEAHVQYAQLLMNVGRFDEAIRTASRAVLLDRVPVRLYIHGAALLGAGRYEEALAISDEAYRLDPEYQPYGLGIFVDAWAKVALGRYDELRGLPWNAGGVPSRELTDRGIRSIQTGNYEDFPQELLHPVVLMRFGRHDEAAELMLSQAHASGGVIGASWMPLFDPIRDHPAFLEALRLAGLEGVTTDRRAPGSDRPAANPDRPVQ